MHAPHDAVIRRLVAWGARQDTVRTMLLTSTRAVPRGPVDELSDYDVILVVRDIGPFATDRGWIGDFGEVLVAYWDPVTPDPETGCDMTGNIIQYASGLKIDFRRTRATSRRGDVPDARQRLLRRRALRCQMPGAR